MTKSKSTPKKAPRKPRTPPPAPTRYALPMAELGALVGITGETLRNYVGNGCPEPPREGGRKQALAWARTARKWIDALKAKRAAERPVNQHNADPEAAKWQREWQRARAERAQLELDRERRLLVDRTQVVELSGKAVLAVRSRMNAMVQKMANRLENVPGHVVIEELQAEVDDICQTFAQGMSRTFAKLVDADAGCPFCEINERRRGASNT